MVVMYVRECRQPEVRISGPADSYQALKRYWNRQKEHFLVLTLNGAHDVIAVRLVSMGLVNRTIVHAREVFWWAIKDNACAVILAHNHPSGRLEPSPEDEAITKRLQQSGEILGIDVLDHLIIAKSGYYSFREHGMM